MCELQTNKRSNMQEEMNPRYSRDHNPRSALNIHALSLTLEQFAYIAR